MKRLRTKHRSRGGPRRFELHPCPVSYCSGTRQHWEATCPACWARMPFDKRDAITAARRAKNKATEAAASIDAVTWLEQHSPAAEAARRMGER